MSSSRTVHVVDLGAGCSRRTAPVTTLASGHELALTIHVVQGAHPGPTVGVSAMIHGDELDGLLIARELYRTLDPEKLRGAVWILGVANPLAMEGITRNTPIDMLDMNRLFPGAPDGWLSEQQAYVIAHEFIDQIDYLIDIHAGGTFPWVDYCYVVNDEGLSRAFLPRLLYKPTVGYPGTTATYAEQRGVKCMVVEIGGGYRDQQRHVANGVHGVLNQLRYTGALEGEVERRPGQLLMREMKVLRPRHGGICVPRRALIPGDVLPSDTALADIVSPYTFETLETMVAPFDQNIVVLCRNYITRIHPGDYGFMMGNAAAATTYTD
ncbi:MAG: succinylglutamate desuccinylase/aspartoacylase family protein [Gemmatimonadaceae bacterium]